jgi:hypothetical protein
VISVEAITSKTAAADAKNQRRERGAAKAFTTSSAVWYLRAGSRSRQRARIRSHLRSTGGGFRASLSSRDTSGGYCFRPDASSYRITPKA